MHRYGDFSSAEFAISRLSFSAVASVAFQSIKTNQTLSPDFIKRATARTWGFPFVDSPNAMALSTYPKGRLSSMNDLGALKLSCTIDAFALTLA